MKNKKIKDLEALLLRLSDLVNEIDQVSHGLYKNVILLKCKLNDAPQEVVCLMDFLHDQYLLDRPNKIKFFMNSMVMSDYYVAIDSLLVKLPCLEKFLNEILKLKKRTSGSALLDNIYFSIACHMQEENFGSIITSPVFINLLTDYLQTQPSLLNIKVLEFCSKDHHLLGKHKYTTQTQELEKMFKLIQDVKLDINIDDKEILGLTPWHKLDVISSAAQQILEESGMVKDLQLEGSYGLY